MTGNHMGIGRQISMKQKRVLLSVCSALVLFAALMLCDRSFSSSPLGRSVDRSFEKRTANNPVQSAVVLASGVQLAAMPADLAFLKLSGYKFLQPDALIFEGIFFLAFGFIWSRKVGQKSHPTGLVQSESNG